MTIVAGFLGAGATGTDGTVSTDLRYVLLAADSEESGRVLKSSVRRIARVEGAEWKALIAGAGDGTFIDFATQELQRDPSPVSGLDDLRERIEAIVTEIYQDRIKPLDLGVDFSLLCGLWVKGQGIQLVTVGAAYSLVQSDKYADGSGEPLANYLLSTYYHPKLPLYHGTRVAVYLLSEVKKHAMHCGGPSQISWLLEDGRWDDLWPATVAEHERSNEAVMAAGSRGLLYLVDPAGWNNDWTKLTGVIDAIADTIKGNLQTHYPDLANLSTAQAPSLSGSIAPPPASQSPSALFITRQPSRAVQSGVVFPEQPVIQITDGQGNPVSQSGIVVTATVSSGGGTLSGTLTATTNASGVAVFINLSIIGIEGHRTIGFHATGLSGVTSNLITVA